MSWYQHGVVRQQWALLLLIGFLCAVFLLELLGNPAATVPFMAVPLDVTESWQQIREGNGEISSYTTFGTLVSCAFLHADAGHLIGNILFLWLFAALAVELLGSVWMFVIFFFTAFTASLTHVLFNPYDSIPMVGASGAVFGFEGAYLGMAVRWRLPDPHVFPLARPVPPSNLVVLAIIYVALNWMSIMTDTASNIAYAAHLGGFVGGLFLTSFLARKPTLAHPR